MQYKKWINVIGDGSNDLTEYNICDKNGELI